MLFTTWGAVFEVLFITIPVLISVAFVTVAERKTMASMQRRLGPNIVGSFGLLQAFADALKLLLKEYVSPAQSNFILFFTGPIITLIFALLGYLVIPFGPGSGLSDLNLGVLYMLAVSSLSTYGILLAGWSANSKYAFLGSLRSTAQLISYELILSSAILIVAMLTGSLNITVMIEWQRAIIFLVPLFPIFIIFFIGSIAETNRAPFDLAEAESELVSGFMTEHAAVIFVFFFLAEYASIVLICIFTTVLFLGGYLYENLFYFIYNFLDLIKLPIIIIALPFQIYFGIIDSCLNSFLPGIFNGKVLTVFEVVNNINALFYLEICDILSWKTPKDLFGLTEGLLYGIAFGVKTCIMIFIFIWARASFPRIRFDQLMSFCWTILLPIVIAFVILFPCILYSFEIIPANIYLL